jgi:hypothetical protein
VQGSLFCKVALLRLARGELAVAISQRDLSSLFLTSSVRSRASLAGNRLEFLRLAKSTGLTMQRILAAILIGCATLAAASHAAADLKPTPVTGKIEWVYSYEEGQKLARQTGKPMFVVFRCER